MADSVPNPDPNAPAPTDQDDQNEKNVDFPIPEGFEAPKGSKPGQEFEALATLKISEDDPDTLCLLKLDGTDVKPEEEEAPEPAKGDQSAADSMRQALPATGMPSGISSL
jgi:hypothetical protein